MRTNRSHEIKTPTSLFGLVKSLWGKAYKRFLKIRGTPHEVAAGFALGIFIGMSPTMGVQIPLAIFFAALFQWSKVAAAAGVWVSNPITAPFLYGMTYFTGAKLLGIKNVLRFPENPSFQTILHLLESTPQILVAMFIGGIILGIPATLLGYKLSYTAVLNYQTRIKQKIADSREKLKRRKKRKKNKKKK